MQTALDCTTKVYTFSLQSRSTSEAVSRSEASEGKCKEVMVAVSPLSIVRTQIRHRHNSQMQKFRILKNALVDAP